MHVMVATDGSLDPAATAEIATRLAGADGQVTVFSAVEVPRKLLEEMRQAASDPTADIVRELNVEYPDGQAENPPATHWIGDDAAISLYVNRKVRDRTSALAQALDERGAQHTIVGAEAESTARAVLDAIEARRVDVLCIGTHGLGRFEGLLGSISTKLARLASCSVVLVR